MFSLNALDPADAPVHGDDRFAGDGQDGPPDRRPSPRASLMVSFTLNGAAADVAAKDETPLLDVLRNHLGLTGARYGCGAEQCGACVVLVEGTPSYSCTTPLSAVAGKR